LAATTLTAIQNLADFIWNYGRSADGGELYDVLYETSTDANNAAYSDSTVTVTRGSNRVVGSGTQFLTRLAPCNGTSYIGIYSATQTYRKTYNVASCTDNTHITLSVNYANPTETVTTWATALRATANCAPSIDSYCDPDPFNGRNLAADGIAAEGWLYWKTGAPRWLAQSQYFAGKAYGGPAGGPGTTGPAAGPDADGGTNNFTDALPPCGGPPCGGYGPAIGQGKAFGMNAGAGDAPNALAYMRGGAPQIMIRALSVAVDLASFPAGTSALVTVVQPSGQTDQTACPASPCEVTVDAQQGDHLMTIDYLSPAGNVIGPGKPTTLKVRP
jgi:hypothetical protein